LVVADLGKALVAMGVVVTVIGMALILLSRTHIPIGRLPGDIVYRGKQTTVYFPLATSILLSAVLSALVYFISRFRR
jgi:hypothetical protein